MLESRGNQTLFTEQLTAHGVQMVGVAYCPEHVHELYRGFIEIPTLMFDLATIVLGLFGRNLPEYLTVDHIHLHKITTDSNKNYLVAMTELPEIACGKGGNNFVTIDINLFRQFIADVHQTHRNHLLSFPDRLEKEKEHIALAVLYCCIKKVTMGNETLDNPFYLSIHPKNQQAHKAFGKLYCFYLDTIRRQYQEGLTPAVEAALYEFVNAYMTFYRLFATPNPFQLSLPELKQFYPQYTERVLNVNPELRNAFQARKIATVLPPLQKFILAYAKKWLHVHAYTKAHLNVLARQK